ncbi:uncharacterized protein V6R79_015638 [Siganus canaliculatus]
MKLYSVLVLMVTLSAAYGLRCYQCGDQAEPCRTNQKPEAVDCPAGTDTCLSAVVLGVEIKGCSSKAACRKEVSCCDKDLCNGAITAGSSVLLLLLSSAIITTFL